MNPDTDHIEKRYELAREQYAHLGVDTDIAVSVISKQAISIQCWQGDDIGGFEHKDALPGGGIMVTGNYPGKARTPDELRSDLRKALSLIPGKHRINLHAIYAETQGKKVERDELQPEYFANWIDWAKEWQLGIDFNPTFFSHPKADSGFTLSNHNQELRKFWVRHGIACRKIGAHIGQALVTPCVTNFWIPDGHKDLPADRKSPRLRLKESLDEIFTEKIDARYNLDAVESKLFGIGSESYVVGSHEFYLGYAIKNNKLICLDCGHFHPTEAISDKISSILMYVDEILFHVSRGVRWDSDHIVILNDDLIQIAQELVRGNYLDRVHIGLDFFDASVNRIAAWVIGTRSMIKALLYALLEPYETLQDLERKGNCTARLALMEELKSLAFGAVWDFYCYQNDIPVGLKWLDEIKSYEQNVLFKRR